MPRFAANLSMLYNEHPFLDRFAAAAADGFTAVEYLFPYDFTAPELARQLADHGLQQVLFNAPPGDWNTGERGLACLPGLRRSSSGYLSGRWRRVTHTGPTRAGWFRCEFAVVATTPSCGLKSDSETARFPGRWKSP
jgi:hypothetical protein